MLKALFKKKNKNDSTAKPKKEQEEFISLDERPLFDKPEPKILTFDVEGMNSINENDNDIQSALQTQLQVYMQETGEQKIEALAFSSAQVIFFPDTNNKEDPYATKVYLEFNSTPLHIGYVPAEATELLIHIINNNKARSFKGTFTETINPNTKETSYLFTISINYVSST